MMERKQFEATVKASDDEKLIVEHFISTESRDRVGDIVRASGMRVKGKPVVLLGHGHEAMGSEPIAKPLSIKRGEFKGSRGILAKTQFFPDEIGRRLYEKTINGYMPSWSIGFITLREDPIKDQDGDPPNIRRGREIKEWELLEYSLVGVPAQPDAQTIGPGGKGMEYAVSVKFLSDDRKNDQQELLDGDGKTVKKDEVKEVEIETDEKAEDLGEEFVPDEKPFPNEHACRIHDPAKYEKMRRKNNAFGEGIHAIFGIKEGKSEVQALRFAKEKFTPDEAKAWAKDHDYRCIEFEAASGKDLVEEEIVFEKGGDPPACEKHGYRPTPGATCPECEAEASKAKAEDSRLQSIEETVKMLSIAVKELLDLIKLLPPAPTESPASVVKATPEKEAASETPPDPPRPPRLVIMRAVQEPSAEEAAKKNREAIRKVVEEVISGMASREIDKLRGKVE